MQFAWDPPLRLCGSLWSSGLDPFAKGRAMMCYRFIMLHVPARRSTSWPESVQERTRHRRSTLHCAVRHGASLEVVMFLVSRWPSALHDADEYGWLPLHAAAAADAPLDVIFVLAVRYPKSMVLKGPDSTTET